MPGPGDLEVRDEAVSDHTHVVTPVGEVDVLTASQLGRCLLGLVEQGKRELVVDLSGVTFMDSTGIGVLLNAVRRLGVCRGQLLLVCPTERILRPFQITGLTEHLKIFRSREEALGSLAPA